MVGYSVGNNLPRKKTPKRRKKKNKRNCMVGFLECFSCVWLLCVVHGCTNFNEHSLMLYWRIQVWINCQRWITISDILSYFNGWSEKARLCASYFGCCCFCCCSLVFFSLVICFVRFCSNVLVYDMRLEIL